MSLLNIIFEVFLFTKQQSLQSLYGVLTKKLQNVQKIVSGQFNMELEYQVLIEVNFHIPSSEKLPLQHPAYL